MNVHFRTFPATQAVFPDVAAFVESVGSAAGFNTTDRLRLTLLIEELFTNAVVHGGAATDTVALTLTPEPGRLLMVFEDSGPPFAFRPGTPASDVADLDRRRPGGLGLVLVTRIARQVDYVHREGKNRISIVVEASGDDGTT